MRLMSQYRYKRRRWTEEENAAERVAIKARSALNYAISRGRITRPTICALCASEGFIEAHHKDYSKPLDVLWVCSSCHKHITGKRS